MFFLFTASAATPTYTLSLHDALPISRLREFERAQQRLRLIAGLVVFRRGMRVHHDPGARLHVRSEEHTSELQSRPHLVCRLLLEKKNRLIHFSAPLKYARQG